MYLPLQFKMDDLAGIHDVIRNSRLASFVTATAEGLIASPLPLFLEKDEGEYGTLYGHVARPNPQWATPVTGEAMAIFMGPEAYVSPEWYATKRETGRVVPTWNYVAVHAYGPVEFFEDEDRLRAVVGRLTDIHEQPRPAPWKVADAPENFIRGQLRGIVGLRMPIMRIDGKRKMSQNRNEEDRRGVVKGLMESERPEDRVVADIVSALSPP